VITNKLLNQLEIDEGYRRSVYPCSEGFDTVGIGYNLDANPLNLPPERIASIRKEGIGRVAATALCVDMCKQLEHELSGKLPWWSKLNEARQEALINMCYNLGIRRLMGFKKTLAHMERGDYAEAAAEMLNSKWAQQVGNRAVRLARQMATGAYA
jgi:lysozyme